MVFDQFASFLAGGTTVPGAERDERADVSDGLGPVAVDPDAVASATDGRVDGERSRTLAELFGAGSGPGADEDRLTDVAATLADDGAAPSAFVAAHEPLVDEMVDRALADVEDSEAEAAALKESLGAVLGDIGAGVDAMATAGGGDGVAGRSVDIHTLIDAIPHSAFLIDDEHTVLAYNEAVTDQLGIDRTDALGEDCRETIAAATYSDGRRHDTLADKIVKAPRRVTEEYDVERADDAYEFGSQVVYEDRSVMHNADGVEKHISFQAMPFFDDGELVGVLELVEDRSTEVKRKQAMEELVEDVCTTLERLAEGDFGARATFEDEADVVDDELLRIVTEINEMIGEFETLIQRVGEETTALAASIDAAADAAADIDAQATEQNESLEQVAAEMQEFSATMEEVAASASEVSAAADDALDEAGDGREAALAAQSAVDEVTETSEALVETVDELEQYMAEIETVTDVIADVAEQTNILALNANIEAARAGEDGQGFAVVAEEVKALADETQSHTEDIAERVAAVTEQTGETVAEVERSHEHISRADARIETAVDSLDSIAETVEDAAAGIGEVAQANDDQAATVEEVLATVEEASDTAALVESTAGTIVDETDEQQASVASLSNHVDDLVEDSTN